MGCTASTPLPVPHGPIVEKEYAPVPPVGNPAVSRVPVAAPVPAPIAAPLPAVPITISTDYKSLPPVPPAPTTTSTTAPSSPIAAYLPGEEAIPDGSCIVAIDFGTSRSAFAYGFAGRNAITLGVPNDSVLNFSLSMKAETSLVLDNNLKGIAFGLRGRKTTYLENKGVDMYLFQWFKMHLADIKNDSDTSFMVEDYSKRRVSLFTVITEALSYIAASALEEVNRVTHPNLTYSDIHWAITVPAIWSPAASGFMRRAALAAGLIPNLLSQKLTLVREPEAACMDLLNDLENKNHPVNIVDGDEMVVLDCGGGTHDMTFIKVLRTVPMRCRELKEATGGKAGAVRIDNNLRTVLRELFGERRYQVMQSLPVMIEQMDLWEQFKMTFKGETSFTMRLSNLITEYIGECPEDPFDLSQLVAEYNKAHSEAHISESNCQIKVPREMIRFWFDEVIDVINEDLKTGLGHQKCQSINYLYMVGGFCANKYLIQKVNEFLKFNFRHRNINVIQAKLPDVAIVRGAVVSLLRCAKPLIEDHIAKCAYGIQAVSAYVPGKHRFEKSYVGPDGERGVDLFHLYVPKGASIPLNFRTPPQSFLPASRTSRNVAIEMYTIDDPTVTENSVIYIDDPRVCKMVSLRVPLNMRDDYNDRSLSVSLKFGMETIILAKDRRGIAYGDAECVFYSENQ